MGKVIKNVGNISITPKEHLRFRVKILEVTPEGFHKWGEPFDVDTIHILEPFETEGILARGSAIQIFTPEKITGCKIERETLATTLICAQKDKLEKLL